MPNHVTNIIVVSGDDEQREAMFEAIKNDEFGLGSVDFNKVIPMPEALNIECGSRTDRAMKLYKEFFAESAAIALANVLHHDATGKCEIVQASRLDELTKKYEAMEQGDHGLLELGEQCYSNLNKYGASTWYDWAIPNWGTKWNSYGYSDCTEKNFDGSTLNFDTAWSNPRPIIEALATKYPHLGFEHKWADEDFGQNVGHREYVGGEETFSNIPKGGSKDALELASEVLDIPLDEMRYVLNEESGEYEYHDPDEEMSMKM